MAKTNHISFKKKNVKEKDREEKNKFSNKHRYRFKKLGDWENLSQKGTYLISVIYDLPGKASLSQVYGRVFDPTHWHGRINLFKNAAKKLSDINAFAICLPADFIGTPCTRNGLIPEGDKPNNEIIQKITKSRTYKELVKAWNKSSQLLIFGYGYNGSKKESDQKESDQLVCMLKNKGNLRLSRKWADLNERKNPKDWSRQIKLNKKKLSVAVCHDLEKFDWGKYKKKYKDSILVDCRHISTIGQKKNLKPAERPEKGLAELQRVGHRK